VTKNNVIGIIAEYNPFHNGHAYHIRQAVELADARAVVVVLSSNFVQRGEPSLQDKWSRAEGALAGGADLVLELPVPFSCHNAGVFARGAVKILASTGVVTHLSFGMETEVPEIERIVDILLHEPQPFKEKLKSLLECGTSYVEARAKALDLLVDGAKQGLSSPNNNLALAYLVELARIGNPMIPLPVRRVGAGYHSREGGVLASASALRYRTRLGRLNEIRDSIPMENFSILLRDFHSGRCVLDERRILAAYRVILARSTPEEIALTAEMGEGMEYRLKKATRKAEDLEGLIASCVSKRYPRGRISRHLVHVLIGLDHWTNRSFQRLGPPCIRVLGMTPAGRRLLAEMRGKTSLPVISRCDETRSSLVARLMELERKTTDIWETFVDSPRLDSEKRAVPVFRA